MSCPKSLLGMTTGISNITGRELFCVIKAYFDGSFGEDEKGDQWITLAGIAATDSVWAEFDRRWSKMLSSRYPIAPYIHMIELLGNDDPFETHVGWDFDKKKQLVQDAIVLLSQMNKSEFRMTWCSINESARTRLVKEGLSVPFDPFQWCSAVCVFATVGTYSLNIPDEKQEPLFVFYDRGEKFLGKFKNKWLSNRTRPGRPKNPDSWWDSFANIQDLDLPHNSGLQSADMIAWGASRSLSDKERPFSYLKEWLLKVIPSSTAEYTEERLRSFKPPEGVWVDIF